MANYLVHKSVVQGSISIPPSKSHTLRAILFASLARGKSLIHCYLPSPDTFHMINACRLLGAHIAVFPSHLEIEGTQGKVFQAEDVIQSGNSGIILRFLSAVAALSPQPILITGDHSIRHQRPMGPLLEALKGLGASAFSTRGNGYAPLFIQGPIRGGKITLCGEDSQYVSALLIASSFAEAPTELSVQDPGEKPWVDLTLHWLNRLGIPYMREGFTFYRLEGNASYDGFEYTVPGDLSTASFPTAAALITQSDLLLHNVDLSDPQGDQKFFLLLEQMGACLETDAEARTLWVRGKKLSSQKKLCGVYADVNDFIDAITILAVLASYAEGKTILFNAKNARNKECDRIHCITQELKKMGGLIEETEDGIWIQGSPSLQGACLSSHQDHRMALSLTIAALGAEGLSTILSTECIQKTFPCFLSEFQRLGANIQEFSPS